MSQSILDEVKGIIEDRHATHGDFEKTLTLTAKLWSAYLDELPEGYQLQPHNVCDLENLKKIARSVCGVPDREHYLDIAGYCDLAVRVIEKGGDDGN